MSFYTSAVSVVLVSSSFSVSLLNTLVLFELASSDLFLCSARLLLIGVASCNSCCMGKSRISVLLCMTFGTSRPALVGISLLFPLDKVLRRFYDTDYGFCSDASLFVF